MADPTITALLVKDATGSTQNASTVSLSSNLYPAHVSYGWDGSSLLHPALVDSNGRQLVSGAAASGSAVAGNPVLVAGSDGTNARSLATDASGVLKAPFSRLLQLTSTFTPLASYATGNNFGGLFTFDASATIGAAAQEVRVAYLVMTLMAAAFVAANGMTSYWFNANPTSTTVTDGSNVTLNTADKSKVQYAVGVSASTPGQLGTTTQTFVVTNQVIPMMTDAAGKLYMILICSGAQTITIPAVSEMLVSLLY
jgi:hypothetical protein